MFVIHYGQFKRSAGLKFLPTKVNFFVRLSKLVDGVVDHSTLGIDLLVLEGESFDPSKAEELLILSRFEVRCPFVAEGQDIRVATVSCFAIMLC